MSAPIRVSGSAAFGSLTLSELTGMKEAEQFASLVTGLDGIWDVQTETILGQWQVNISCCHEWFRIILDQLKSWFGYVGLETEFLI